MHFAPTNEQRQISQLFCSTLRHRHHCTDFNYVIFNIIIVQVRAISRIVNFLALAHIFRFVLFCLFCCHTLLLLFSTLGTTSHVHSFTILDLRSLIPHQFLTKWHWKIKGVEFVCSVQSFNKPCREWGVSFQKLNLNSLARPKDILCFILTYVGFVTYSSFCYVLLCFSFLWLN